MERYSWDSEPEPELPPEISEEPAAGQDAAPASRPASALPIMLALIMLSVFVIFGWGVVERLVQRQREAAGSLGDLLEPQPDGLELPALSRVELPAMPSLPPREVWSAMPVMPAEQPYREPQFPISYQEVQR